MIAVEDDDVLAERKGLGYGMECRIRGHVFDGFPPRKPVVVPRHIEHNYDNIIRARRATTYYIRTEEQDVEHYGRRLA